MYILCVQCIHIVGVCGSHIYEALIRGHKLPCPSRRPYYTLTFVPGRKHPYVKGKQFLFLTNAAQFLFRKGTVFVMRNFTSSTVILFNCNLDLNFKHFLSETPCYFQVFNLNIAQKLGLCLCFLEELNRHVGFMHSIGVPMTLAERWVRGPNGLRSSRF